MIKKVKFRGKNVDYICWWIAFKIRNDILLNVSPMICTALNTDFDNISYQIDFHQQLTFQ